MRFFTAALALAAVPAAVFAASHTIKVGDGGQLKFDPDTIKADVGDTVNFMFMTKNHSVTQSTFTSPCTRAMFNGTPGVSSGFLFIDPKNPPQNGSQPTWSVTIKKTGPLWFYCGQKIPVVHCEKGMVMSINPTADKTQAAFLSAALASTDNSTTSGPSSPSGPGSSGSPPPSGPSNDPGSPGNGSPSGGGSSGSSSSSGTSSATSATSSAVTSQSTTASSAADNSKVKSGASRTVLARGAAGLFTVAAAVSAALL